MALILYSNISEQLPVDRYILYLGDYNNRRRIGLSIMSRYEKTIPKPLGFNYPRVPQSIGEHVRKRRMDFHLLQKDIAKLFGVVEETITNWENGHAVLQVRYYPKLISFLGYYPFPEGGTSIGESIRKYRFTHGLSHKKMGKMVGVDATTIGSWERNQTMPFPKMVEYVLSVIQNNTAQ